MLAAYFITCGMLSGLGILRLTSRASGVTLRAVSNSLINGRFLHSSCSRLDDQPVIGEASNNTIIFESSTKAKWLEDAASLADLPPQGDLASLGLGGYSPIGLLQSSMEWLHVHGGLPWWAAIIVSSIALRLVLFPLAVRLQVNAVTLNNLRPQTDKIMAKMKEYQQLGNQNMAAQESARLMMLYQKNKCNPLKMMVMPFIQIPIFVSFFVALRRMAYAPVESMKQGGALWFTDLTVSDPMYILPFIACGTFIANIELGGEAGVTNPQVENMKFFFRIMAIIIIPLTATFPSALFMYWLTSSFFSMGQILILKIPAIRGALGIPVLVKHPPPGAEGGPPKEGVMSKLQEAYKRSQLISEGKAKEMDAKKSYNKLLSNTTPKLYDKPPHKRT